jgi:hypothetical protein
MEIGNFWLFLLGTVTQQMFENNFLFKFIGAMSI